MSVLRHVRDMFVIGNCMRKRQEIAGQMQSISAVLLQLQERLERMESRLSSIETRLDGNGASDSRAWAKTANAPLGASAFGGVVVSGSNAPSSVMVGNRELLLSSTDEQIVSLVGLRGVACAEDVQAHFKYKGKNAASARLNRLASLGVLEKQQAGRRVYYKLRM